MPHTIELGLGGGLIIRQGHMKSNYGVSVLYPYKNFELKRGEGGGSANTDGRLLTSGHGRKELRGREREERVGVEKNGNGGGAGCQVYGHLALESPG